MSLIQSSLRVTHRHETPRHLRLQNRESRHQIQHHTPLQRDRPDPAHGAQRRVHILAAAGVRRRRAAGGVHPRER